MTTRPLFELARLHAREQKEFKVRGRSGDIRDLLLEEFRPQPDCLVVDYGMPVMNGFDVLHWLREKKVNAPAILITGRPNDGLRDRALAAGFSRVVEKPLLGVKLADDIREVLIEN